MAQKKAVAGKAKPAAKPRKATPQKATPKSKPLGKSASTAATTIKKPAATKSKSSPAVAVKSSSKSSGAKGAKVKVAVKSAVAPAAKTPAKKAQSVASKSSTAKAASSAARAPVAPARKPAPPSTARTAAKPAAAPQVKAPSVKATVAAKPKAAAPVVGRPPAATGRVAPAALAPKPEASRVAGKVVTAAVAPPSTQNQKVSAPVATAQAAVTAPKDVAQKAAQARDEKKPSGHRHGFKTNEFIVYPAHGVGRIVGIEEQEIAGMSIELFVITFEKDKMTLRVPTSKLGANGMRKLAEEGTVKKALEILKGRARIKRTMWSRRAQEYEAKINSGDLVSIAEVVRDLYRSESQPEQSYSERQLYEAALDRMARELAAVERLDDRGAVQRITDVLSKSAKSRRVADDANGDNDDDGAEVKAA